MKRILFVMFLVALVSPVFALDADFSASYMTRYMFRGERLIDNAFVSPKIALKSNHFELSALTIHDTKKKENFRNIYELAFKTQVKKMGVDVGFVRYDPKNGVDTNEFFAKAEWKGSWRPSLTVFFDFEKGSGKYVQAGFAKAISSGKNEVLLGTKLGYVMENGYMGLNKNGNEFTGLYDGEVYIKSSFKWGKHIIVEPMIAYTIPLSQSGKEAIKSLSINKESQNLYGGLTLHTNF